MSKTACEKKVAVYSRKSKFTGKGESIENQIELCKSYIKLHFENISDNEIIIYEDEGFSGGTLERPQFKKMLSDAENNKLSAIVCYRLDRISRNIGDFAKLISELEELKVSFISIKEQFDTTSPMGRAMMYISSVFSQLERETIAERIRDNMLELAKTGRWLGGTTPTGYKSEPVERVTIDGKTRKAFKLTILPGEMETVKTIFQKFMEYNSLTKTETYLMNNGIRSKNGKLFSRFTIRQILENPVYVMADMDAYRYFTDKGVYIYSDESEFDGGHGIMAYNKTLQRPGRTNEARGFDEWIVAAGKHRGVITGGEYAHVMSLLEQNKSKGYRKPKSNTALLSGLLRCSLCGSFMRPKLTKRQNKDGEFIYDYICELKEKSRSGLCSCKNANGNILDEMVCGEIVRLQEDVPAFMKNIEAVRKEISCDTKEYEGKLISLKRMVEDNRRKIDNLVKCLSDSPASEYITGEINSLHAENGVLKNQIKDYEQLTENHFLPDEQTGIIKEVLLSFGKTFDAMSTEEKRAALRTLADRILWDGEGVDLYLLGAGNISAV